VAAVVITFLRGLNSSRIFVKRISRFTFFIVHFTV